MVTRDPLNVAYYCTGHGLGHATRSIEVCKFLCEAGHSGKLHSVDDVP